MKKIIISLSLLIGLGANTAHGMQEQLKKEAQQQWSRSKLGAAIVVTAVVGYAAYNLYTKFFRTPALAPQDIPHAQPNAQATATPGKLAPEKSDPATAPSAAPSQGDQKSAAAKEGDARETKKRKLGPTKKFGATIGKTINQAIASYAKDHTHLYTYYSELNDNNSLEIWHEYNTHRFSIRRGSQHFSIQAHPVAQMIIDDSSELSGQSLQVGTDIATNKPTLQACFTDIGQIRLIVTAHKKKVQVLLFKKNT